MANPYSRCGKCGGNMWPPNQMEHPHVDATTLKRKYRTKPQGWNKAAAPRTNAASKGSSVSIRPRKRAYGPF